MLFEMLTALTISVGRPPGLHELLHRQLRRIPRDRRPRRGPCPPCRTSPRRCATPTSERSTTSYSGAYFEVPYLPSSSGSAYIQTEFFVDEAQAALPSSARCSTSTAAKGLKNRDASGSYELLPMKLTLSYTTNSGTVTRELYVILGAGVDITGLQPAPSPLHGSLRRSSSGRIPSCAKRK